MRRIERRRRRGCEGDRVAVAGGGGGEEGERGEGAGGGGSEEGEGAEEREEKAEMEVKKRRIKGVGRTKPLQKAKRKGRRGAKWRRES